MPDKIRKIIHIDMDAFFASVEQREAPTLRGRPVIVGGRAENRGVVATCSYEARQFGIHSAMPTAQALKLCPQALFVEPNFALYQEISEQLNLILTDYSDQIEPVSLDEAYLDVSDSTLQHNSATLIARDIKQRIQSALQLTASAGVSYNKFLAKAASECRKPNGLTTIEPSQGEAFVAKLPIGQFHGIGQATEQKMLALGIHNGEDLKAWSLDKLAQYFGKAGQHFYHIARGKDFREIVTQRIRKSVGCETTFPIDIIALPKLQQELIRLAHSACERLQKHDLEGKTLTLKVKYADFTQITRRCTLNTPTSDPKPLLKLLPYLLVRTDAGKVPVRLLGVSLSNLNPRSERKHWTQLSLDF